MVNLFQLPNGRVKAAGISDKADKKQKLSMDIWQKKDGLLDIFYRCVMIVSYLKMEMVSGRELFEMQRADRSNDVRSQLSRFLMGANYRAYDFLGVHAVEEDPARTVCRVWAPNAKAVSFAGNFNGWKPGENPMEPVGGGVWECSLPFRMRRFEPYKFCIEKKGGGRIFQSDPYAFSYDAEDGIRSRYEDVGGFSWNDAAWMRRRAHKRRKERPLNLYGVTPGIWNCPENGKTLSFGELARDLIPRVEDLGYTHVELTPVMEYPRDASAGFGTTGFFAPTSRYGDPRGLMEFVNKCHEAGVGVILDWAPAWFPNDEYGLARFDGAPCYEYADPGKAERREQNALVFDFGRGEVISFLISSAVFWLERYHADGLRVCGIESMLYLDYSRERGEWLPNLNGGNENLEAVSFLQRLNEAVHNLVSGAFTVAEETAGWPMVSRPVRFGGLGFDYKWNTAWRKSFLRYMTLEPQYRKFSHDTITFPLLGAFSENYILPLSTGDFLKEPGFLWNQLPGETRWKSAGLRALLCFMTAHPGKKLVFSGAETAGPDGPDAGLLTNFVRDLNRFYLATPALWEFDFSRDGFAWLANDDCSNSILAFRRISADGREVLAVCNFLPEPRVRYRIGVPERGLYAEIFSSDREEYGGSGITNGNRIPSQEIEWDGFGQSLTLTLPPLSVIFLKCRRRAVKRKESPGLSPV